MLGSVACLAWTFKPIRIFHQTRSDSAYIADSRDKSRGDISAVYKPKTQAVKHQRFVWMGGAESVSFECNTPGSARPRGCALGGAPRRAASAPGGRRRRGPGRVGGGQKAPDARLHVAGGLQRRGEGGHLRPHRRPAQRSVGETERVGELGTIRISAKLVA